MIKIKNLNKIFNENKKNQFQALNNINLEFASNSCTILKGISGSGKSTLLSIIATLQKPSNGEVIIHNENISKLPDIHASNFRALNIGFVFQSFNLFDSLSVKDNVCIPLIPLNLTPIKALENINKALNLANIDHKKDETVFNLSGGEKQRCAIARALVNNPEIILCDEPTANLDLQNSLKFIEVVKNLKNQGKTIIIATHDTIFDDLEFVDNIININNGKVCE